MKKEIYPVLDFLKIFFFFGKGEICIKTKPICYKRPFQYQGCKADPPQAEDGQTKEKGHH